MENSLKNPLFGHFCHFSPVQLGTVFHFDFHFFSPFPAFGRFPCHVSPTGSQSYTDPKAAAYVRNDGEVKWHLNDLDVATVEEMNLEEAMEGQNLRALGMGWAWYVNALSKYLPDADALANMTPADVSVGMAPEIPLSDIDLEPEVDPEKVVVDPYVVDVPFPHAPPGPAENELMEGDAPALLPRSQDVDLVVSAVESPMPPHLKKALKTWSREDLNVHVFQGVRTGGPRARQVCCRETFDMNLEPCWPASTLSPETLPSLIARRLVHRPCLSAVSFGTLTWSPCRNPFARWRQGAGCAHVLHDA